MSQIAIFVCGPSMAQSSFYDRAMVGSQIWAIVILLIGATMSQTELPTTQQHGPYYSPT